VQSMGDGKAEDTCALLALYVERHNESARFGERRADALFEEDAEFQIEGLTLSNLRVRAMGAAFRNNELVLWKIGAVGEDVAFASYAWRRNPRLGGLIRVQRHGRRIRRLTLRPGYSRIFAMLADAESI
jgi:hypothetical protein